MSLRVEAGFEHLRDAFAQVMAREVEFPVGILVTVLAAKVTANTSHAKITLSVFPADKEKEVRDTLKSYDHELKTSLMDQLRLRRIPRLHYVFDTKTAYVSEIDAVIHELKEKGEIE
jgi:ribosome-binding factor A